MTILSLPRLCEILGDMVYAPGAKFESMPDDTFYVSLSGGDLGFQHAEIEIAHGGRKVIRYITKSLQSGIYDVINEVGKDRFLEYLKDYLDLTRL